MRVDDQTSIIGIAVTEKEEVGKKQKIPLPCRNLRSRRHWRTVTSRTNRSISCSRGAMQPEEE